MIEKITETMVSVEGENLREKTVVILEEVKSGDLDRNNYECTVRKHRTVPSRCFDCRNNKRWHVWEDYEKKILNPELEELIDSE